MITDIEQLKIAALETDKNIFMTKYREVFAVLKANKQGPIKISRFMKQSADIELKPNEIYSYLKHNPITQEEIKLAVDSAMEHKS